MTEAYMRGFCDVVERSRSGNEALLKEGATPISAVRMLSKAAPLVKSRAKSWISAKTYQELVRMFEEPGRALTKFEEVMKRRLGRNPTFEEAYKVISKYKALPEPGRINTSTEGLRKKGSKFLDHPLRTAEGQQILKYLSKTPLGW